MKRQNTEHGEMQLKEHSIRNKTRSGRNGTTVEKAVINKIEYENGMKHNAK